MEHRSSSAWRKWSHEERFEVLGAPVYTVEMKLRADWRRMRHAGCLFVSHWFGVHRRVDQSGFDDMNNNDLLSSLFLISAASSTFSSFSMSSCRAEDLKGSK